jgi:hypothetical protein
MFARKLAYLIAMQKDMHATQLCKQERATRKECRGAKNVLLCMRMSANPLEHSSLVLVDRPLDFDVVPSYKSAKGKESVSCIRPPSRDHDVHAVFMLQ